MKRLIPFLALAILVLAAPSAMATHCDRCRLLTHTCGPTTSFPGYAICYWDDVLGCVMEEPCPPEGGGFALAAEFTVASVERLDERGDKPAETLVAANLPTQPTTR